MRALQSRQARQNDSRIRFREMSRFISLEYGPWCTFGSLIIVHGHRRDTVSSIGIIKGKNLPGTVSQEHICYFRHALALDERRVKFLPEYAHGGVMLDADVSQQVESSSGSEGSSSRPRVKETWFTGTHSDM